MKKLLIILAICLVTSLAFASIRLIGNEPMRIGGGGISFYRPAGSSFAGDGIITHTDSVDVTFTDSVDVTIEDRS